MNDKNVFYTCPYCKEEYSEPADLAHCILSCEEKKRIEEAEAKKAKLAAEKETRFKEVVEAYKHADALRDAVVEDYGYFTFETTSKKGDSHSWYWNSIGLF
jgi:hypothetical protein